MFFDDPAKIPEIARHVGTAVFVLPEDTAIEIKNALLLAPEAKSSITIEEVKNLLSLLGTKQSSDRFIIIRPAEAMTEEAANALLKNIEEPKLRTHFLLITSSPSSLLPTILSRSAIYFLRTPCNFEAISADPKVKALAKQLIAARSADLVSLAENIAKTKDNPRAFTLSVLATAIEILYKSYFLTQKTVFLQKLPRFLAAHDAISKNGHLKLQLVANLL